MTGSTSTLHLSSNICTWLRMAQHVELQKLCRVDIQYTVRCHLEAFTALRHSTVQTLDTAPYTLCPLQQHEAWHDRQCGGVHTQGSSWQGEILVIAILIP